MGVQKNNVNAYTGSPNWRNSGYYYIHLHQYNIGKAQPGTITSSGKNPPDGKIAYAFNQLKKQKVNNAVMEQYKTLFLNNLNIGDAEYNYISQLFNSNGSEDILRTLNNEMQKALEEHLNIQKIENLLKLEKGIKWDGFSIKNDIMTEKSVQTLDSLLEALAEGVKEINSTYGKAIAAILIAAKNDVNKGGSFTNLGANLLIELEKQETLLSKGNKTVNKDQMLKAVVELKKLAAQFKNLTKGGVNPNKKSAEPITADAVKSFVEKQLFSTVLGETVAAHINTAANKTTIMEIKKSIDSIVGSGKDTMKLQVQDEFGRYTQDTWDQARQIKSDVRFNNVTVHTEDILGPNAGEIKISFGISNKAYKTNSFGGSFDDFKSQTFSVGGGMTVGHAIDMMTSNDYLRYLAYNTFARSNTMKNSLHALQNAIFTRSIIYLFGSRNIDDFANFILLNGKLVTLWDIILYAINNNIGLSSSEASQDQAIMFSIDKKQRQEFTAYVNEKFHQIRVANTNQAINSASLHAKVRPAALMKVISKT